MARLVKRSVSKNFPSNKFSDKKFSDKKFSVKNCDTPNPFAIPEVFENHNFSNHRKALQVFSAT